jgi:acyl carrier protein
MKRVMREQELFVEVESAIRRVFRVNGTPIHMNTTFIGDLGAESIDFLDLGCDLEKVVDTEIDFRTLFEAKRGAAKGAALDLTVQELVVFLKRELDSSTDDQSAVAQHVSQ